jgi:hypothetical protein
VINRHVIITETFLVPSTSGIKRPRKKTTKYAMSDSEDSDKNPESDSDSDDDEFYSTSNKTKRQRQVQVSLFTIMLATNTVNVGNSF